MSVPLEARTGNNLGTLEELERSHQTVTDSIDADTLVARNPNIFYYAGTPQTKVHYLHWVATAFAAQVSVTDPQAFIKYTNELPQQDAQHLSHMLHITGGLTQGVLERVTEIIGFKSLNAFLQDADATISAHKNPPIKWIPSWLAPVMGR